MTAENFLEGYKKIDTIIKNKESKRASLEAAAVSVTSHLNPDKVQTSGSKQKMAESVNEALDLTKEIEALEPQRTQIRHEIESVIEKLPLLRYTILFKKYIEFWEDQEIADAVDRVKDTVKRQTEIALKEVQHILDEKCDKIS